MIYRKDENYYLKVFLEKYNFHSNNFYYEDSAEKCYDEKCIDLFLETIRKIWWIYFLKN